jgi:antitoxin MazE
MAAKTRIIRIGNSRGIRIPKTLLEEAELPDEVELHAEAHAVR